MNDQQNSLQVRDKLLKTFEAAISSADWESTLFLRSIGKRLREMRQSVIDEFAVYATKESEQTTSSHLTDGADYVPIYISIYQADGYNIEKWRYTVKALCDYPVSRPVYAKEQHVKLLIRNKTDPKREAYLIAYVRSADILPSYTGKPLYDRFNQELVTLKEGCIKLENIVKFMHEEKVYTVKEGQLMLTTEFTEV